MPNEISTLPVRIDVSTAGKGSTQAPPAGAKPEVEGTERPQGGKNVPAEKPEAVQPEEVSEALETLNQRMEAIGRNVRFRVDPDSGHTVISVIDRETDEVIRQIPAEEALERIRQQPSGVGLLLDVT